MSIATKRQRWKQNEEDYFLKDHFLLAGLQLLNFAKNVLDTAKPYKSKHHLLRDLSQVAYGLYNIFLSILHFALLLPLRIIVGIGAVLFGQNSLSELGETLYDSAAIVTHAITLAIHGLIQIVTTPLVWVRAIGKGIYAAMHGWQLFNNNTGVKSLVKHGLEATNNISKKEEDTSVAIANVGELHRKVQKALGQGQRERSSNCVSIRLPQPQI